MSAPERPATARWVAAWVLVALFLAGGPGLQIVVAQADVAGVRAAVEHANSPTVWGEALRRGDPAPLAAVWEGDPLGYFSSEVIAYRGRGLRLLSTLVELEFLDVRVHDDGRAVAVTRERWFDRLCTETGELRGERSAEARDRYTLTWREGAWWVSDVQIELLDGSFDWTPASDPPDRPSPCAAVLAAPAAGRRRTNDEGRRLVVYRSSFVLGLSSAT